MNFETFVFFDIETTGLPMYNFNKSNIIELSFLSSSKKDIIEKYCNQRASNKLTLSFNPRRGIHPNSSKYSGLDNYMLENEKNINENAINCIIGFLEHLKRPICLVAHNGNEYDFPIFRTELKKLNIELPKNIYCIDSYPAIEYIDKIYFNNIKIRKELTGLQEAEYNIKEKSIENENNSQENFNEETEINNKIIQNINETTPNRLIKESILDKNQELIQTTASTSTQINLTPNRNGCKRKLSFSSINNDDNNLNKSVKLEEHNIKNNAEKTKQSYKLSDIYERIFDKKKPEKLHQAETDAKILQEIIFYYGEYFINYSDKNAKPFDAIKILNEMLIKNMCNHRPEIIESI